MSLFPTRLQIKSAVADKLPFEGDIDSMIQEMQDRLYDAGVAPGSRREVDLDFSTARVTWNLLQVVQIDAGTYDGLVLSQVSLLSMYRLCYVCVIIIN